AAAGAADAGQKAGAPAGAPGVPAPDRAARRGRWPPWRSSPSRTALPPRAPLRPPAPLRALPRPVLGVPPRRGDVLGPVGVARHPKPRPAVAGGDLGQAAEAAAHLALEEAAALRPVCHRHRLLPDGPSPHKAGGARAARRLQLRRVGWKVDPGAEERPRNPARLSEPLTGAAPLLFAAAQGRMMRELHFV